MKKFNPVLQLQLDDNGVTDNDTVEFARDTLAVYGSLFQGMAPIGDWIQARVSYLVRKWLPDWVTSHGQVADEHKRAIQSRSWDIIVHRKPPADWGYPPPATPEGPWPLVPKDLCCAVIDTKGRYDTPGKYAAAPAFDLPNRCETKQLEFLGPHIVPILFIVASSYSPESVEDAGNKCGIPTFVIAKAVDHRGAAGTQSVDWRLNSATGQQLPMSRFRQKLVSAATRWEAATNGQTAAQIVLPSTPKTGQFGFPQRSSGTTPK